MAKKPSTPKSVESLNHDEAKRKNIPTAEYQSVLDKDLLGDGSLRRGQVRGVGVS